MKTIDRDKLLKEYAHLKQPGTYFEINTDHEVRSWSDDDNPDGGWVSETIYPKHEAIRIEQLLARHYFTSDEWAEKTMQGTVENYLQNRLLLTPLSPEETSAQIKNVIEADDTFDTQAHVPSADKILNSFLLINDPYDKQVFYEIKNYFVVVSYKHVGKMS